MVFNQSHSPTRSSRRQFLGDMAQGLSGIALASLLAGDGLLAEDNAVTNAVGNQLPIRPDIDPREPFAPRQPHFPARAKNVIVIFCSGACSHLDTFDYKPSLIDYHGKPMPGGDKLITFQGAQGNLTRVPGRFILVGKAAR